MKHFFKNCVLIEWEVNWEVQSASKGMFQNCRAPWGVMTTILILQYISACLHMSGVCSVEVRDRERENDNAGVVLLCCVSRCDPPAHWVWCNPWWVLAGGGVSVNQHRTSQPSLQHSPESSNNHSKPCLLRGWVVTTTMYLVKCKLYCKLWMSVVQVGLSVSKESHPNKNLMHIVYSFTKPGVWWNKIRLHLS